MLLQAANGAISIKLSRRSVTLPCRLAGSPWSCRALHGPARWAGFLAARRRAPGHHDYLGSRSPWWRIGASPRGGLAWRRLRTEADKAQGASFGVHRRGPPRFSAICRAGVLAGPGPAGCLDRPELLAPAVEVERHLELRDRAPGLQFWLPQLHDTLDALVAMTMMLVLGLHLQRQRTLVGGAHRSQRIRLLGVNETWQKRQQGQEQAFPSVSKHGAVPLQRLFAPDRPERQPRRPRARPR